MLHAAYIAWSVNLSVFLLPLEPVFPKASENVSEGLAVLEECSLPLLSLPSSPCGGSKRRLALLSWLYEDSLFQACIKLGDFSTWTTVPACTFMSLCRAAHILVGTHLSFLYRLNKRHLYDMALLWMTVHLSSNYWSLMQDILSINLYQKEVPRVWHTLVTIYVSSQRVSLHKLGNRIVMVFWLKTLCIAVSFLFRALTMEMNGTSFLSLWEKKYIYIIWAFALIALKVFKLFLWWYLFCVKCYQVNLNWTCIEPRILF